MLDIPLSLSFFLTLKLCVSDLDFQEGMIFVDRPKGQESAYIYMNPNLQETLDTYVHYHRPKPENLKDRDRLFIRPHRGNIPAHALTYDSIRSLIRKYRGWSGLPLPPHSFRRAVVTHLFINGHSAEGIQTLTLHKSAETLRRHYFNPSEKQKRAIVADLSGNETLQVLQKGPKRNLTDSGCTFPENGVYGGPLHSDSSSQKKKPPEPREMDIGYC